MENFEYFNLIFIIDSGIPLFYSVVLVKKYS